MSSGGGIVMFPLTRFRFSVQPTLSEQESLGCPSTAATIRALPRMDHGFHSI